MHKAYTIVIKPRASRDISNAYVYIAQRAEDPYVAAIWEQSLREHINLLESFPNSYGRYAVRPYRKISHGNFLIIYRVDEIELKVVVCRVFRGARLPRNIGPFE